MSGTVSFGHLSPIPALFLIFVPFIITVVTFCRAAGLAVPSAIGASVLAVLASAFIIVSRLKRDASMGLHVSDWVEVSRVVLGIFIPTLGAFILMLVQKWRRVGLTSQERIPGAEGIRAWLTPLRLCWIALLAGGLNTWFDAPFWVTLFLMCACLIVFPVLSWATIQESTIPAQPALDSIAPEREKVLNLISENRITAEEGADLLNALAAAMPAIVPARLLITREHKLVLAGAMLMLVGLFLPWISYNPGKEAGRLAEQMNTQISTMMPGQIQTTGIKLPSLVMQTANVQITGAQLSSGLGWIIFLFAVAVAAMPFLADAFVPRTQRTFEIVGLAAAGFVLLYVLSQSFDYIAIGLVLALAGYLCEVMGVIRKWHAEPVRHV